MTQDNDVEYYRRREASARCLAEESGDPQIKRIHLDMADGYATKIRDIIPLRQPVVR